MVHQGPETTLRIANIASSHDELNKHISLELTQCTVGSLTKFCKTSLVDKEADIRELADYNNFIRSLDIDYQTFEMQTRELFKKSNLDENTLEKIME